MIIEEMLGEFHRKPIQCRFPVADRHRPLLGDIVHDQIDHLVDRLVDHALVLAYVDQTYKTVPEFFTPLQGNADMLVARLTEILAGYEIRVEYRYVDYGAEGGSVGGVVYIRSDLPSINKFLILAHETAHELLHKAEERLKLNKQTKECQAETVAYLVASRFGIHSPISADYLKMYGVSAEVLRANMKITQEISHKIIEKMEEEYDLFAEFKYDPSEEDAKRGQYRRPLKRNKGRSKRK